MAPETLIFMPNGDVTLVLTRHVMKEEDSQSNDPGLPNNSIHDKNSSANRLNTINEDGPQEPASGIEPEAPAEPDDLDDDMLYFAPDPPDGLNGPSYPPPPRAARGSDASSLRDRSASPPASFWASLKRQAARVIDPIEDELPEVAPPSLPKKAEKIILSSHEVHCTVSSRHLMLASQHFETLLSGNFKEANILRRKGHVTISLSADFDTMVILLNIIHGASRKVPRQVSLEELSKLAILVSSLGMLENVEFFSDTWIDNFQSAGLPRTYNGNVLPLLFVFWVFNRPDEFKNMTRLAQRESTEKLHEDVLDVPIPQTILDEITKNRVSAMDASVNMIHSLIDKYLVGQTVCDGSLDDELRYACDSMVLGSLMKSSRKIGIWPRSEESFIGKNFKTLAHAIRDIKILDVCNKTSNRKWNSHGPSSNCHGLEDSIEASMKSIEANLDGLNLSDYEKKSEDLYSEFQTLLHTVSSEEDLKDQVKEDAREIPYVNGTEETKNPPQKEIQVPQEQNSVEIPPRTNFRVSEAPIRDQKQAPTTAPRESLRESPKPETHPSARTQTREVQEPVQEVKMASRPFSRELQEPEIRPSARSRTREVEEPSHEMKVVSRPFPRDLQQPETRPSARIIPREVEEPVHEVKIASRPFPREFQQPDVRASPRNSSNGISEPKFHNEEPKGPSRPFSREFHQPEVYASPRNSVHQISESKPHEEESKAYSNPSPREFHQPAVRSPPRNSIQEVSEPKPHKEEPRGPPKLFPRDTQQPEVHGSPRNSIHEVREPAKQEAPSRPFPREFHQSEIRASPRNSIHEVIEPTKEEIKGLSRPFSREFDQPPVRISPRPSAHEVREPTPTKEEKLRVTPRNSPNQEMKTARRPGDAPRQEEAKSRSREDVTGSEDRRMNQVPSHPKIPREDVRSPVNELQVAPKLASIEEMFEKHSKPVKETLKPVIVDTRDSPTTTPPTTDVEETWAPPKNFKIRKSKKVFSTRF